MNLEGLRLPQDATLAEAGAALGQKVCGSNFEPTSWAALHATARTLGFILLPSERKAERVKRTLEAR